MALRSASGPVLQDQLPVQLSAKARGRRLVARNFSYPSFPVSLRFGNTVLTVIVMSYVPALRYEIDSPRRTAASDIDWRTELLNPGAGVSSITF